MAGEPSSTHNVFFLDLSESGTSIDGGLLLLALRESGIHPFIIEDEEELLTPRGDEITPALATAIQASKIVIVVLTGYYHDVSLSRWKVLAYILDYFQDNPQFIIPVYYMDRSAARATLFSFDDTFEEQKKVMAQVDNLHHGWHFCRYTIYIEFHRKIASQVSKMLICAPLYVAVYPVGLGSRLEEVLMLLRLTSTNRKFLNMGFYGRQGIGKSTLARAVYNSIAHLFEVSCFLHNIRENSNKHGLAGVQKMLLSEISGETDIQLENVGEGVSMIKDRLCQKDVLLILDDVDSLDQLEALGRGPCWRLSSGSRVIITTRDKHLLTYYGNDILLYDVLELSNNDALELLCHRAFEHGNVDPRYTEVLIRAIRYASGHPLVLDMIGSYSYGRSVDECENALDRLERIPLNDIQSIQGVLTTSESVSEVSQTLLIDPEGSQTTMVAGVMSQSWQRDFQAVMWRLVCVASSGVGLLCNALSPPFKRLIRGWNPLKLFLYVVFSLGVVATILYSNRSKIFPRLKCYICYVIFLCISVYSCFYDIAVDGKPGILSLVSNAAFALVSLSLSKLFEAGFDADMFSYFLGCFTIQLLTINWKLIFVAIIFGGPLFCWHFSSEPSRITRRFGTIPLRNLNRRFSGGRHVIDIQM